MYYTILPIGFFIALAIVFIQKAIRVNAKRTWGWGRVGGKVPLSRASYAVWGVTFLIIAGVLFKQEQSTYVHFVTLGVCVVAIAAAGSIDTWIYRKNSYLKK